MSLSPDQLSILIACERAGVTTPKKKNGRPRKHSDTPKQERRRAQWRAYHERKAAKVRAEREASNG